MREPVDPSWEIEVELLRCPFCGSCETKEAGNFVSGYVIACVRCGAKGPSWRSGAYPTSEWNTRVFGAIKQLEEDDQ